MRRDDEEQGGSRRVFALRVLSRASADTVLNQLEMAQVPLPSPLGAPLDCFQPARDTSRCTTCFAILLSCRGRRHASLFRMGRGGWVPAGLPQPCSQIHPQRLLPARLPSLKTRPFTARNPLVCEVAPLLADSHHSRRASTLPGTACAFLGTSPVQILSGLVTRYGTVWHPRLGWTLLEMAPRTGFSGSSTWRSVPHTPNPKPRIRTRKPKPQSPTHPEWRTGGERRIAPRHAMLMRPAPRFR